MPAEDGELWFPGLSPGQGLQVLENKALRCVEISRALFPHESDGELKTIAFDFMCLTDNEINRILLLLRAPTKELVPMDIKKENRYSILRKENEA